MDQYMHSSDINSALVDQIVCEVKSQGLFDQFRRECLADVDTKPAYQNLQHRVETSVLSFLSDQIWTPELNKNQLREKLRRSITEKGFLDTGVERIVDQVVNPKLNTNFVPKIEDVSYKYLGIEKPVNRNRGLDLTPIDQNTFLPNLDLEQVSPESEQSPSICSKSPKSIDMALNEYQMDEINDKGDDLESPAFEPIEKAIKDELANAEDDDKMDISSDEEVEQNEPNINGTNLTCNTDDVKSNLSSISGLTSNDSINGSSCGDIEEKIDATTTAPIEPENIENTNPKVEEIVTENEIEQTAAIEAIKSESSETPKANDSTEIENINQDSVLSQVSSNSRLSIITNNNTNTRMDDADDGDTNNMENVNINSDDNAVKHDICPYGISEEAQMQKFNESSSSNNSLVIDMDNASNENSQCDKKDEFVTVFDINKEEIKFEGTERKSFDIDVSVIDSKSMEDVKLENQSNGLLTELKQEEFPPINECVETVNNTIEMSKEMKIKRENINSVSSDNNVNNVLKTTSPKLESTSNDVKLEASGTEDSKNVDDSNSSNKSKLKDKNDSKSSSSHRNGNESDNKSKSKNRNSSSSSSKDRHRGHSDRDKDKKYHSSSSRHSSSRDKNRSLKDESESKGEGSSKHRESSSSTSKHRQDDRSKNYHKSSSSKSADVSKSSSSSSKRDKDHSKERDRSRTERYESSSSSKKKEYNRHSSTSSSQRDSSKLESKHSDKSRSRSESQKSTTKKDDHFSYKDKPTIRQRSRSKDSNDGSANSSNGPRSVLNGAENTISASQAAINDQQTGKANTSEPIKVASDSLIATQACIDADIADTKVVSSVSYLEMQTDVPRSRVLIDQINVSQDDNFVLPTQPVVVDQILTGSELNLELFIGENRSDPVVSSIERTLSNQAKVKKPRVAANMFEARKLMKVRKQIKRKEEKQIEQARVLAKQYIRSNATSCAADGQGVELEFACMNSSSGINRTGPKISSPVKFINGKEMTEDKFVSNPVTATVTSSSLCSVESMIEERDYKQEQEHDTHVNNEINEKVETNDIEHDFNGFTADALATAAVNLEAFQDCLKNKQKSRMASMKNAMGKMPQLSMSVERKNGKLVPNDHFLEMMSSDNQKLFYENNKIGDVLTPKLTSIRKRKCTETSMSSDEPQITKIVADEEMILASVYISETPTPTCNAKTETSATSVDSTTALEKQRQKTRYSNDDLFKPRPVFGVSRSRRRGINCTD